MFAVEGTVANAYLLYLAEKFQREKNNGNARKIFLCSLWYLPVLLVGFVFHSRMWATETINEEAPSVVGDAVNNAKGVMKGLCVHEMIATSETNSAPQLCMKSSSDKVQTTNSLNAV